MKLTSIRRRLPLSYAGIALLAALSLGSVMLLVLNGYYARQERGYLFGNALALQPMIEQALRSGMPLDTLQQSVDGLAFLSQTRIRVLDEAGNAMVDSGIPASDQLILVSGGMPGGVVFSMSVDGPIEGASGIMPVIEGTAVVGETGVPIMEETIVTVDASPFGYGFVGAQPPVATTPATRRSSQSVSLPLSDSLGTLVISDGPAYGRDIVRSVALAWAGAGVVAILLAGLAGLAASRQVTRPVLTLTGATQRMQAGDLSARVDLPKGQGAAEFQALAHSFNGMARRVEDTVATLRAFAADAAHELHTPLTALHTNLELAAEERDAARRGLFLERAQEQSQRLEALVSGLLDLSRIEAAEKAEAAPFDILPLAREVGEQFAARAEQGGQSFTLELPAGSARVRASEADLRRVLTNLLENALKFTPAGGAIALRLAAQGEQVELRVSDTGIGIPPEDLPHLFERFHRGRNASRYPGSGLGLAIVKALVEARGGSMRAESEPGRGTSVIVSLPSE